jgi:hypothetical protein
MTLKEFRDLTKDFNDEMAERTQLAIGIKDEKDIVNDGKTIYFPEFTERYIVNGVNLIAEGTMAPKLFFVGNRK